MVTARGGGEGDERVGRRAPEQHVLAARDEVEPLLLGPPGGVRDVGGVAGGRQDQADPHVSAPHASTPARESTARAIVRCTASTISPSTTPTPDGAGLDHEAGVGDLLVGRGEGLVRERDLRGVDADLAVVAEVAADGGVGAERLGVVGGDDGLVEQPDAGDRGREHHLAAREQHLLPARRCAGRRPRRCSPRRRSRRRSRPVISSRHRATPRADSRPPITGRSPRRERRSSSCSGDSSLGSTTPSAADSATAATSSAYQGVVGPLTRISTSVPPSRGSSATARTAASRADSLSPAATASSRSTATASGDHRGTLATMSGRAPGTNSRLRGTLMRAAGA